MNLLADAIASGHLWGADFFFLVGAIGLVVAGLLAASRDGRIARWAAPLAYVMLGFVAFGWFLL